MPDFKRCDGSAGRLPEGAVLLRAGSVNAGQCYVVEGGELCALPHPFNSLVHADAFEKVRHVSGINVAISAVRQTWDNSTEKYSYTDPVTREHCAGQRLPDHD